MLPKKYFFHLGFWSAGVIRPRLNKSLGNLLVDYSSWKVRIEIHKNEGTFKDVEFSEIFVVETKTLEMFQLTIYWANKYCVSHYGSEWKIN